MSNETTGLSYRDAGVDVEAADAFVDRIAAHTKSTHNAVDVLKKTAYAGLVRAPIDGMKSPLIAATCDGVGTKLLVARQVGWFEGLGQDLVAMNVEPEDFGLSHTQEPELPLFSLPAEGQGAGDTPGLVKAAGEITEAVLSGEASGARNAALLGAGLILKASGRSLTLADGVDEAVRSLDSGAPRAVLDQLRDLAE